jgi:hypothetical protein
MIRFETSRQRELREAAIRADEIRRMLAFCDGLRQLRDQVLEEVDAVHAAAGYR